jgi:hypothetical protein
MPHCPLAPSSGLSLMRDTTGGRTGASDDGDAGGRPARRASASQSFGGSGPTPDRPCGRCAALTRVSCRLGGRPGRRWAGPRGVRFCQILRFSSHLQHMEVATLLLHLLRICPRWLDGFSSSGCLVGSVGRSSSLLCAVCPVPVLSSCIMLQWGPTVLHSTSCCARLRPHSRAYLPGRGRLAPTRPW